MRAVLIAFGRALRTQLHFRMLMLTVMPFVLSVVLWGFLLWFGLQPMIDWLHAYFAGHGGFHTAGRMLDWIGLSAFNTVLIPLIAMWMLLPLMILTALLFVGTLAMPGIVRHVGRRHYAGLEMRRGGSLLNSLWVSGWSFAVFAVMWLATLPLSLFPPLTFVIQPLLWGWLTCRVMACDALADHASRQERKEIMHTHRWQLLLIGSITGAMGAAPTLLWLGGAVSVIFFPLLAAGAIWLYVLAFVFTGLWFQHYCLEALVELRAAASKPVSLKKTATDTAGMIPSADA